MVIEQRFDDFVVIVVALEEAVGLPGDDVVAVQEGMVALGAGACAGEEDVVAVLQDDAASGGQAL